MQPSKAFFPIVAKDTGMSRTLIPDDWNASSSIVSTLLRLRFLSLRQA